MPSSDSEITSSSHSGAAARMQPDPRSAATPEVPRDELEPPPLLGSWRRLYTALVLYLFATISLLYALTRMFHYT